MSETPLIGVTTYRTETRWGAWECPAALVPTTYLDHIGAVGGQVLLVPPSPLGGSASAAVIGAVDGMVFIGGGDLDPAGYGLPGDARAGGVDPARDDHEGELLRCALAADLPILAICRGHQLLNVALGGTLIPHLPERPEVGTHLPGPGQFADVTVTTAPGSLIAGIYGDHAEVRCSHHQGIDKLADGLVATAWATSGPRWAADEGLIEAVEMPGTRWVLGVQWHPEESEDPRLFRSFLEACR